MSALLIVVGAAGTFLLTTVMLGQVPDALLAGVGPALALGVAVARYGPGPLVAQAVASRGTLVRVGLAGAVAFWAAPLLVVSQRATDAPPGSETLFFTTVSWSALLVVTVVFHRRTYAPVIALAAAVTGVAGAAGLLANWERPSSFSPFVRYPTEELIMLLAGALFAVATIELLAAAERLGSARVFSAALAWAAVLGAGGIAVDPPALASLERLGTPLLLLGIAHAAFTWGWLLLIERRGPHSAGAAIMLVPVAVTSLAVVERARSVYGANPVHWSPALAAITVLLAAAVVLAFGCGNGPDGGRTSFWSGLRWAFGGRVPLLVRAAAAALSLATVLSVAGLFTPAVAASVRGLAPDGARFSSDWTVLGIESATGWLAVGAALLALSGVVMTAQDGGRSRVRLVLVAALVTVVAAWFLRDTSLYTVTRWMPAEIQQAYGTEYARIRMRGVIEPVRYAALGLTAVAALLALSIRNRPSATADVKEEVAS